MFVDGINGLEEYTGGEVEGVSKCDHLQQISSGSPHGSILT
jgi:hypothetical protein